MIHKWDSSPPSKQRDEKRNYTKKKVFIGRRWSKELLAKERIVSSQDLFFWRNGTSKIFIMQITSLVLTRKLQIIKRSHSGIDWNCKSHCYGGKWLYFKFVVSFLSLWYPYTDSGLIIWFYKLFFLVYFQRLRASEWEWILKLGKNKYQILLDLI